MTSRHDLLVSSFDPLAAQALQELGLDGQLQGARDDYLYLVEQNVCYGKLSPFIHQDLQYTVELAADASPTRATLAVEARNTYALGQGHPEYPTNYYAGARWNEMTRRLDSWEGYYGGYTRLFLPLGSTVASATGFDDGIAVSTESGRTVIGGYRGLPGGAGRRLEVSWKPAGQPSVPGQYRLLVQRQPGAPVDGLSVRARLPDGYVVETAEPTPSTLDARQISWRTVLDRDRTFLVRLRPA